MGAWLRAMPGMRRGEHACPRLMLGLTSVYHGPAPSLQTSGKGDIRGDDAFSPTGLDLVSPSRVAEGADPQLLKISRTFSSPVFLYAIADRPRARAASAVPARSTSGAVQHSRPIVKSCS